MSDISALCGLYLDFHEYHADRLPERLLSLRNDWESEKESLSKRIREIVASPDAVILLAESDGDFVGFSELYLRCDEETSARPGRRYCHLQSMFVLEQHRRRGTGRVLLRASESWAESNGASEIRLDVWEFQDGPAGFYQRCGYRPYRHSLARPLG
jgi:GNAT superfamily N-acetyltransferase